MNVVSRILLLLVFVLKQEVALAQFNAFSNQKDGSGSHGGDDVALEFSYWSMKEFLENKSNFSEKEISLLKKSFLETKVFVVDSPLCQNDDCSTGIYFVAQNFPLKNMIKIHRHSWNSSSVWIKKKIGMHEYMGMTGLERDNYAKSIDMINFSDSAIAPASFDANSESFYEMLLSMYRFGDNPVLNDIDEQLFTGKCFYALRPNQVRTSYFYIKNNQSEKNYKMTFGQLYNTENINYYDQFSGKSIEDALSSPGFLKTQKKRPWHPWQISNAITLRSGGISMVVANNKNGYNSCIEKSFGEKECLLNIRKNGRYLVAVFESLNVYGGSLLPMSCYYELKKNSSH